MRIVNRKLLLASAVLVTASSVFADNTLYPGPGYTTSSGGYRASNSSSFAVNPGLSIGSNGTPLTIATETYYTGGDYTTSTIKSGIVINPAASGGYTVLSQPPGDAGNNYSVVAINPGATLIAGQTQTTSSSSTSNATVWTPDGTPYVLPLPLEYSSNFLAGATSRSINDSGTVVGAGTYSTSAGVQSSSASYAYYNAGNSTVPSYSAGTATQLTPIGPSSANSTFNFTTLLNSITASGVAAGQSSVSVGNTSAAYWNVGNTATTSTISANQLTISPVTTGTYAGYSFSKTDANGNSTGSGASSIVNAASSGGYAGGSAVVYPATSGTTGSTLPVRWNSLSSTPGTVLSLPSSGSYISGNVFAINNHGDAVGVGTVSSTSESPLLWKGGSTTPTVLGTVNSSNAVTNPGNQIPASPGYSVRGINDSGYSVGYATATGNSSTPVDGLLWDSSGNVTELNSLITLTPQTGTSVQNVGGTNYSLPTYGSAGWVSLVAGYSITNDGYISGLGVYYDPNDVNYGYAAGTSPTSGGTPAYGDGTYYRTFEIGTPEPSSLLLVSTGAVTLLRRRRR